MVGAYGYWAPQGGFSDTFDDNSTRSGMDSIIQGLFQAMTVVTTVGYGTPAIKGQAMQWLGILEMLSGVVIIGAFVSSKLEHLMDYVEDHTKKNRKKAALGAVRRRPASTPPPADDSADIKDVDAEEAPPADESSRKNVEGGHTSQDFDSDRNGPPPIDHVRDHGATLRKRRTPAAAEDPWKESAFVRSSSSDQRFVEGEHVRGSTWH